MWGARRGGCYGRAVRPDTEEWRSAQRRAELFDAAARAYDRYRVGYPDELYATLAALVPDGATVVEIGAGTGIATVPLARRGYRIVGLEPGAAMAAIAREKLAAHPQVEIAPSRFEDWAGEPGSVDLVFAADAWHWVDQDLGPRKVRDLLRPGGHLAITWHVRRPMRPPAFADELAAIVEDATPDAREWLRRTGDDGSVFLPVIEATGLFEPIVARRYPVERELSPEAFAGELGTFSWVLALPEAERTQLLERTRELVRRQPRGVVGRQDDNVLYLARRPNAQR